MEYDKTGQFTDEQRSICKKIRKLFNDGKKKSLIFKLKDKCLGVLITDHNVRETLPLTERAYLIYDGKILVEGDQNTLLNDTNARRLI